MSALANKLLALACLAVSPVMAAPNAMLRWDAMPGLPFKDGVAGPFTGVSNGAPVVAGGANFPVTPGGDLWSAEKIWHDAAYVLPSGDG